ncbi:MAG TPA: hypothetical protein VHQ20_00300 [Patescibacteria group bacterium]|jgi:hypothetical protein|nr:hypothetical protein [Patescibacteria group bacterium]
MSIRRSGLIALARHFNRLSKNNPKFIDRFTTDSHEFDLDCIPKEFCVDTDVATGRFNTIETVWAYEFAAGLKILRSNQSVIDSLQQLPNPPTHLVIELVAWPHNHHQYIGYWLTIEQQKAIQEKIRSWRMIVSS